MATGEQEVTQAGGWQEIIGASGSIILQNQGGVTAQYYIGAAAPTTQSGVILAVGRDHLPNVKTGEKLFAKAKANILIAWSE